MKVELIDALPSIGAAFDVETHLAQPKHVAPLVCGSIATAEGASLLTKEDARATFLRLLEPGTVIMGAFIAYDMVVMAHDFAKRGIDLMPRIFAKYDRGEIYDVILAEMLDAIAGGHLGRDPRDGGSLRDPITRVLVKRYKLGVVCDHVLWRVDAKQNDFWRLRYAILDGIPFDQWPANARQYPIDDAINTRDIALAQCGHTPRGDGNASRAMNLHAVADIARASFVLYLGAIWGFTVDHDLADRLGRETQIIIDAGAGRFVDLGLIRADGSGNEAVLKKLVATSYQATGSCPRCDGSGKIPSPATGKPINCRTQMVEISPGITELKNGCDGTGYDLQNSPAVPRAEKGGVSTARDILVDSGDDDLIAFGDWGEEAKTVKTYVPALKSGLMLYPNVPLVNERVSYGGIVQTMPRGKSAKRDNAISVRECVLSRPGTVYSSIDFTGVELCTWAQCCIWLVGFSDLADVINATPTMDAHSVLGSDLVGIPYEEFYAQLKGDDETLADDRKQKRQAAKWGNFGFAGGMGAPKFVVTNRKAPGMTTKAPDGRVYKGIRFCLLIGGKQRCGEAKIISWKGRPTTPVCKACVEAAVVIREAWKKRWSEVDPYFKHIAETIDQKGYITHFGSGVIRGGVTFTSGANGYFSSLAAVGAKRAFYAVSRECYTDRHSVLWGSRPIAFIHDEAVCEHPEDRAAEAAMRVGEIMVGEMQKVVPDVKIRTEPALMRRLYKGAEAVYDGSRNLIPWEPS